MVDIVTLRYPKKSHRKKVVIPAESNKLAEFFGIMIGDGGINNPWQANVTLNTDADAGYVMFVGNLMQELFAVKPRIMTRKTSRATVVSLASTSVVDFLVEKGLVRGSKLAQGISIPDWILAKKTYKIACVRGLVDTDGCLVLHEHVVRGGEYKNLYLCFSNKSRALLEEVAEILVEIGLRIHITGDGDELYIYSSKDVEKYLQLVGSSNERLLRVHQKWRDG